MIGIFKLSKPTPCLGGISTIMRTKGITKKGSHLKIEGISISQFGFHPDLIEISLTAGVIFEMASRYLANL